MFTLSPQDQSDMISFLRELIRTPSLSTKEGKVAARLATEMERLGFSEVHIDRIGNVVGRIGRGEGKKLLYNGHMDTVDIGDPGSWRRDPFGAEVINGVLYGRGASDMKGGLVAMVYGAKMLIDAGVQLPGDLYVVGVVQEEPNEGFAMRVLVEEEGLQPDFVVLGEPTDLQICRGHRGRLGLKVTARGRSCHASNPEQGSNAVYSAARLIFGMEMLAPQLTNDSFLGQGTLAVTHIESTAGSRNAIPDSCTFYVDRRLTFGETEAKAVGEIQSVITREGVEARVEVTEYEATSYTGYRCRTREYYPPWAIAEDHPLVQATARAIRETLGYRPRIGHWPFSTDGVYTMGQAGIPTVGFGPGSERHPHTAEDQIRLADVVAAAQVYARLAIEVLGAHR